MTTNFILWLKNTYTAVKESYQLRAVVYLICIVFIGLSIIISPFGLFALFMVLFSRVDKLTPYVLNIWIGIDQLISTALARNPDHTISGEVGYHAHKGSKTALILQKIIDKIFLWFTGEERHCWRSIEWDRVKPAEDVDLTSIGI